jgi:transcriptional regulator with XRE-family HTH domain
MSNVPSPGPRRYGAPLDKETVRRLRVRAEMTQEELAERLGLAGKAVVSGWETGRTTCDGPAAELLLHLLAGADASRTRAFAEIDELADATWRRTSNWNDTWRQVSAVPDGTAGIEFEKFATLFPGAEIPPDDHVHGFPFVNHGLPASVFGISSTGWSGSIPAERERAPRYTWHLTRTAEFAYREVPWELALNSITEGHTHVGSLLEIALSTTVFLGRLADRAGLDPDLHYDLRIELEGMQGRGVVGAAGIVAKLQPTISTSNRVVAGTRRRLGDIIASPRDAAIALVGELMILLRPDFVSPAVLLRELRARVESDKSHGPKMRFLKFAEPLVR